MSCGRSPPAAHRPADRRTRSRSRAHRDPRSRLPGGRGRPRASSRLLRRGRRRRSRRSSSCRRHPSDWRARGSSPQPAAYSCERTFLRHAGPARKALWSGPRLPEQERTPQGSPRPPRRARRLPSRRPRGPRSGRRRAPPGRPAAPAEGTIRRPPEERRELSPPPSRRSPGLRRHACSSARSQTTETFSNPAATSLRKSHLRLFDSRRANSRSERTNASGIPG